MGAIPRMGRRVLSKEKKYGSVRAEYMKQISELEEVAKNVRKKEVAVARAQVHEIMMRFGLTLEDIVDAQQKAKLAFPVKYRHPTDPRKTWNGSGHVPLWLAGEDRTKYLVN
ncbi:MAG: H-NS histone family protein [Burkholderiaceae bacterium]|nr:H-NS histone family protein [Burkholderiaceae bacterium]